MKKVIPILALLIALTGCDWIFGSSPADVVQDFYRLAEKGELTKAYELLSQQGKAMLGLAGGAQGIRALTDEIKKRGGIKSIKITKKEITGEIAAVDLEITYGNDSVEKKKEELIKEDDRWKINPHK